MALHVARMPRGIGARVGVKETATRSPATALRFWIISGVCRCPPPTPYGLMEPMTSLPRRCALGALPAPEVPDAATMTASSRTIPAA